MKIMSSEGGKHGREAAVALVDIDEQHRGELVTIFTRQTDYYWLGAYPTLSEMLQGMSVCRPDVVLVSFGEGDDSVSEFVGSLYVSVGNVRVLVLADSLERPAARDALRAGAVGYILRPYTFEVLDAGIQAVFRGGCFFSRQAVSGIVQLLQEESLANSSARELTVRERAILHLMVSELSDKEIGNRLGIATSTASSHVHHILTKLGIHSRRQCL